jgi:vesicle-fusing ATPase
MSTMVYAAKQNHRIEDWKAAIKPFVVDGSCDEDDYDDMDDELFSDDNDMISKHPKCHDDIVKTPLSYSSPEQDTFETIGGYDDVIKRLMRDLSSLSDDARGKMMDLGIYRAQKGILLHGPPGTGKTVLARRICAHLAKLRPCRTPVLVSGPELMSKYVGDSEKSMRKLFKGALQDDGSGYLNIIIFDECDAILRKRSENTGDGGNNHTDSLVNQFLSMLDGLKPLDNILVIAITNRKDVIDSAVLRSGRIDKHVEIGLPSAHDRLAIFRVYLDKIAKTDMLESDVDLQLYSKNTEGYTGADIEAIVRCAAINAMERWERTKQEGEEEERDVNSYRKRLTLAHEDFVSSFREKEAERKQKDLAARESRQQRNLLQLSKNVSDKGKNHVTAMDTLHRLIMSAYAFTCLVIGPSGSGKSALVAQAILACASMDGTTTDDDHDTGKRDMMVHFIGPGEALECNEEELRKKMTEIALLSEMERMTCNKTVVIIDGLEQIIRYTKLGTQFSNAILHGVSSLIKCCKTAQVPFILSTSIPQDVLAEMGILQLFEDRLSTHEEDV